MYLLVATYVVICDVTFLAFILDSVGYLDIRYVNTKIYCQEVLEMMLFNFSSFNLLSKSLFYACLLNKIMI